jgi:hypothetical protein
MHGVIDYLFGAALIMMPAFLHLDGAAKTIPMMLGMSVIVYSLCTEYELSIAKAIPFKMHKALDLTGGLLLVAAPFLFDFKHYAGPFVVLGISEILIVMLSQSQPKMRMHHQQH